MHWKKLSESIPANISTHKELLLFRKQKPSVHILRYLVFHCCWRIQAQGSIVKPYLLLTMSWILSSALEGGNPASNMAMAPENSGVMSCPHISCGVSTAAGHRCQPFQQMKTRPGEKQNIHLQISPLAVNTWLLEFNALIILHYLRPMY